MTALARLTAWCSCLVGCVWLLTSLGDVLPVAGDDPVLRAFALLRLGALGFAWYLAVVTALGLAARCLRLRALVRGVDLFTVAPVRRLLHASLSAGVTVTTLATPAAATPPPPDPPVIRRIPPAPSREAGPAERGPESAQPEQGPVLRRVPAAPSFPRQTPSDAAPPAEGLLPPHPPEAQSAERPRPFLRRAPSDAAPPATDGPVQPSSSPEAPSDAPAAEAVPPHPAESEEPPVEGPLERSVEPPILRDEQAPSATPPRPLDKQPAARPQPPAPGDTWRVAPGESFWSVAESVVDGPEADVARYWRMLIEANRDRLRDPDNPSLLFVGQELVLPTRVPP